MYFEVILQDVHTNEYGQSRGVYCGLARARGMASMLNHELEAAGIRTRRYVCRATPAPVA